MVSHFRDLNHDKAFSILLSNDHHLIVIWNSGKEHTHDVASQAAGLGTQREPVQLHKVFTIRCDLVNHFLHLMGKACSI